MHGDVDPGSEQSELEAQRFASAFLLPREVFVREFPKADRLNWSHLFELKARWGVSVKALVYRAHLLNIIDAARYRWANIYINRQGWGRGEPNEQAIEEPTLVSRAFEALHRVFKLTPVQVALHLDLEPEILESVTGVAVPRMTVAV
jgi:Zn-dependent peptidase ImmA (M78 family)